MRLRILDGALRIDAPAKINLFLEVLGRRDDGYHELVTVMHPVGLCDTLICRPSKEARVRGDLESLGEENLVLKAVRTTQRFAGTRRGLEVRLIKRIPTGAGLGGGSTDAAAAIAAMNRVHALGLSEADMMEVAARVGSDVAFFLQGRTALCTGRGEKVAPVSTGRKLEVVLLYPGFESSTARVYRGLSSRLTHPCKDVKPLLASLTEGRLRGIGRALFNRLEGAAFGLYPPLRSLKQAMKRIGFLGVLMSGSGSALYGLCPSRERARALARDLAGRGRVWVIRSFETASN